MLDNPILQAALICFMLGLALAGLVRLIPAPSVASLVPTVVFLSSYETTSRELLQVIEIGGDCCNLGLGQAARNRFHYGGCVWFCRIAVPVIAPIHQGF